LILANDSSIGRGGRTSAEGGAAGGPAREEDAGGAAPGPAADGCAGPAQLTVTAIATKAASAPGAPAVNFLPIYRPPV
jgi:hypothetical protein